MTPPGEDLDGLIMTNAYEESRLAELLSDYCKEYPEAAESGARQVLMKRLSELVSMGKVGMYEAEIGRAYESGKDYRDLSPQEALAVISSPNGWDWALSDNSKVMHYLFAKE
jgi:hypothetical protein